MVRADVERMARGSRSKAEYLQESLGGYLILSALAGVYLGLGICLIFSIGAPFAAGGGAALKLVMGASFGIALTLVIFAGSELFTGNNMACTIGALSGAITWTQLARLFVWSFAGNLTGSLLIAWLIAQAGVLSAAPQVDLLMKVAGAKMSLPAWELFVRGILCNWLVCLAVWTASRTTNDAAKLLLIWWCLFAFIGSGFEHSVANQSLLGLALLLPHPEAVSWAGFLWNQTFVVLGNIVGGGGFVGAAYWLASPYRSPAVQAAPPATERAAPLPLPAEPLRERAVTH